MNNFPVTEWKQVLLIMEVDDLHSQEPELEMEGSKREGTKRGRKPGRKAKSDMKAKLERSRQSARECRARKKLRYQYLEELVANREKAVFALHRELDQYRQWAKDIDEGKVPEGLLKLIEEKIKKSEKE